MTFTSTLTMDFTQNVNSLGHEMGPYSIVGKIKSLRVQSGIIILIGGLVIELYVVVLSKFLCKGAKGPRMASINDIPGGK